LSIKSLLGCCLWQVLAKNAHKGVWKFIESITLEEISFGLVPPTFQNALAKYDPEKSILHIAVDAKFSSTSAQVVVRVHCCQWMQLITCWKLPAHHQPLYNADQC
jgi:hypothetical protein